MEGKFGVASGEDPALRQNETEFAKTQYRGMPTEGPRPNLQRYYNIVNKTMLVR